jgi:hypothetical protein
MRFFRRSKPADEPAQRPLFVDEPGTGAQAVERVETDDPLVVTRREYGGADHAAAIGGMLAIVGLTALMGSLAAAAGVVGYERSVGDRTLYVGGFVAGLVILLIAFLAGGWVAGRMARYDGARNGFDAGIWTLIVAAALAAVGTGFEQDYDVFRDVNLPTWVYEGSNEVTVVLLAALGLILLLGAATIGGRIGARYHTRVDDALSDGTMRPMRSAPTAEAPRRRSPRHAATT